MRYGALYKDRWESEYMRTLPFVDRFSHQECSAAIDADQCCGQEPVFPKWGLASRASLSTRLVLVGVEGRAIKEDFLAVSACSFGDNCAPYSEGTANRQLE